MLPDFVREVTWFVSTEGERAILDAKPGAVILCRPEEFRCVKVEHDRPMYDFIAGQISED